MIRKKCIPQGFWLQVFDMKCRVGLDVLVVIQMPRRIEGIAVNGEYEDEQ
jgi:hypothetical protein